MKVVDLSMLSGFEVTDIEDLVDCGLLAVPHPEDGYLDSHLLRLNLVRRAKELNFTQAELRLLIDYPHRVVAAAN